MAGFSVARVALIRSCFASVVFHYVSQNILPERCYQWAIFYSLSMCEKLPRWTIRLIRTALSVLLLGPVLFIGMQWQQIEAEQTSATEKTSGNQQPEFKILPD